LIDCFVKTNNELRRIEINEIYYFSKNDNKTLAVTKDSKIVMNISLYSISTLLEKNPIFLRTHKSYIVNIHKIKKINKFNNRTYNIQFKGIEDIAYCTQKNLKILSDKFYVI